ncbi:unnamed protein product [Paramecium octaurelia]|uniref:Spindle assembly abnormal protein 6 N-terminal domain-containing protein n=1 Tax=Paramecium octaurelia TaxID=43137 RepID=A0A8S1WGG8_PAROT|nr:unnamed protein product [Paramecium octaurelia]
MQENLIQIDFSQIESLDPCVQGGYKIIFNQEIPFIIKFPDQEDQSIIETIRVRIMILGNGKDLQQLTLELSSENDLFFYYFHTVDKDNFQVVKTNQKLNTDFFGYPEVCVKTFRRCQLEKQLFAPVLYIQQNARAQVSIVQTLEYKELTLITFEMIAGDEEIIKQHVYYKHGAVKSKFQILNAKIKDIHELVKVKNPQLLLHLQKYLPN